LSHPRLSITPAGAIFDQSLEPRDQHVLNLLGCYTDKAGWCRRSQVKMAKQLKCGRASIQRSLDRLVEAGWVEKKRPPWSNPDGQPSNSYMYRVVLDRDDFVLPDGSEEDADEAEQSYAETASDETECPPVGTPPAQPDGHPGAQPCVGTGAQPYVGTKNDPLERPPLERERDARARDRSARFLAAFEQRWPTAAADDRQRVAYAAEGLTEEEQQAALVGIGPFLENLRKLGRKNTPAGWRYLEEKRWTLLAQQSATAAGPAIHPPGSVEARAIAVLHEIAGRRDAFFKFYRQRDGSVSCSWPITPQLLALGGPDVPPLDRWVNVDRNGGGSWEAMLKQFFDDRVESRVIRTRMREGSRAPWNFAPSSTGKIYAGTGPPSSLMTAEDERTDFK